MLFACPDDRRTRCGASIALAFLAVILSLFAFLGHDRSQVYKEGEQINIRVNKLTSAKTLMPMDHYRLAFCAPDGGPRQHYLGQNLGQFLMGDRIQSSPYDIRMKQDEFCKVLCSSNLGRQERRMDNGSSTTSNTMAEAIRNRDSQHILVDGMPVVSVIEDDAIVTSRYFGGTSLGFVDSTDQLAYVANHLNFVLHYHTQRNGYEVVRVSVQPFSILHLYNETDPNITPHSIGTCDATQTYREHTNYEMVQAYGQHQPASGKVIFTYDVEWKENTEISLKERWDIFLTMDNAVPVQVHLYSIVNSAVVILIATIVITVIWRRNISGYRRLQSNTTDGLSQDDTNGAPAVESGWKAIRGDIFRPPGHALALAVFCGTGAHLLVCAVLVFGLSMIPWFPDERGLLIVRSVLVYVMTGFINGFVSMRYYKTFGGKRTFKFVGAVAATCYPMLLLGVYSALLVLFYAHHTTYAIPIWPFVVIILLWMIVSVPMVLGGSFVAARTAPIRLPLKPQDNAREIPRISRRRRLGLFLFCIFPAPPVIWPFASIYVELYFSLANMWEDSSYSTFGFMLIVTAVAMITDATVAVMFTFFLMSKYEDYRWWWPTFMISGLTGVFVFAYSVVFYHQQMWETSGWPPLFIYFGYMLLISFSLVLVFGFVGFSAGLWFNRQLYSVFDEDESSPDDDDFETTILEMPETGRVALSSSDTENDHK